MIPLSIIGVRLVGSMEHHGRYWWNTTEKRDIESSAKVAMMERE
jgi:hypothetical protein